MRKKSLTKNCPTCQYCMINDNSYFICTWGNGKPKLLIRHKTKPLLECNLISRKFY